MLFPAYTQSNPLPEPVVVWPHHKAVDQLYFCPSLSCLTDDLRARRTSSFRNVWLVIEEITDCTWLMVAEQPSCPHCGSPLHAIGEAQLSPEPVKLPLM